MFVTGNLKARMVYVYPLRQTVLAQMFCIWFLLLVYRRQEVHRVEPLILDPSPFEVEIATAKFRKYNPQVVIKFLQNCFKWEVKHYGVRSINSLTLFQNKDELLNQWKKSIIVPIYKRGDKTDCNNSQEGNNNNNVSGE
jgi:hypothetical protein